MEESAASVAVKCRSFTRFTAHYAKNASGQCYGHTDLAWVPNPIGPGQADSGIVEWPCEIDDDCSLNGKCAHGTCHCNTGWQGVRCETLSLAPVDMNHLGFSPTQGGRNMSSWGGSIQAVNGTWHMWAVEMVNHCGIGSYLLNSGVVHAVSSAGPLGPYVQKEAVLPPFAHEPDVVRAPTGEFVMITVAGDLGNYTSCTCVDGSTTRSCNTCNNACHLQTPTLSVATSPGGPWHTERIWETVLGENHAFHMDHPSW